MLSNLSELTSLFVVSPFMRVRRNHALEHATLQVLTEKNPHRYLAGYSDLRGFWVLGEVETQDLQQAVDEAHARLLAGEKNLAIHPNCGTNFAATGLLAGAAAWLGMLGTGKGLRSKLDRFPLIVSLVTLVLIMSQPVGPYLQKTVTTDPNLGNLHVFEIMRYQRSGTPMHRVKTR